MNRGGVVLLVAADGAMEDRVSSILVEAGASDLDEREAKWKEAGWMGMSGDGTFSFSFSKKRFKIGAAKLTFGEWRRRFIEAMREAGALRIKWTSMQLS